MGDHKSAQVRHARALRNAARGNSAKNWACASGPSEKNRKPSQSGAPSHGGSARQMAAPPAGSDGACEIDGDDRNVVGDGQGAEEQRADQRDSLSVPPDRRRQSIVQSANVVASLTSSRRPARTGCAHVALSATL